MSAVDVSQWLLMSRTVPNAAASIDVSIWFAFFGAGSSVSTSIPFQFEEAVVAAIKADVAVSAIVGVEVYPNAIAEISTRASIAYTISEDYGKDLDGRDGTVEAVVELQVRSKDYADCRATVRRLRTLFDGSRYSLSGITILASTPIDRDDDYDFADDASDDGTYKDTVRIQFFYVLL